MDAGLAALLGAAVGTLGTGAAALVTGLLGRGQTRMQLRAEHARLLRELRRSAYVAFTQCFQEVHALHTEAAISASAEAEAEAGERDRGRLLCDADGSYVPVNGCTVNSNNGNGPSLSKDHLLSRLLPSRRRMPCSPRASSCPAGSGSWSADRVADLEYANLDWSRQLHATPWLQIPADVLDTERANSKGLAAVGLRSGQPAHHRNRDGGVLLPSHQRGRTSTRTAGAAAAHRAPPKSPTMTRCSAPGTPGRWASYATRERSPRAGSAARPPGSRSGTNMAGSI